MQASRVRRLGLLFALTGATLYLLNAGKPDHKLATVVGIVVIIVGLLAIVFHGLRNSDRNLPERTRESIVDAADLEKPLQHPSHFRRTLALLPPFIPIAITVIMVVLVIFMSVGPLPSRGLYVFLRQEFLTKAHADPAGPVVVHLKTSNPAAPSPSHVFVNNREVGWPNLRAALLSQLSVRADWVVFIDADPALPFSDPVQAIDVVNQLTAKPVLLTRDMAHTPSRDDRYSHPTWIFHVIDYVP